LGVLLTCGEGIIEMIGSNFSMRTSKDLETHFCTDVKKIKKNQKNEFFFGPRDKKVFFLKIYVECIF